jgi:uncharacterized protein
MMLLNTQKEFTPLSFVSTYEGKIESIYKNRQLFQNLEGLSLLLSNACNLKCQYCFEQHTVDYDRFDVDKIKLAWDWLWNINNRRDSISPKNLRFLGGEPLIHKKLILDFIAKYREEIERDPAFQTVSMTSNGLLLDDEFIEEFYGIRGVQTLFSIDTNQRDIDQRGVSQPQYERLLRNVERVIKTVENPKQIGLRVTISPDQVPYLSEYWEQMYQLGIRWVSFFPLSFSRTVGAIEWKDDVWTELETSIRSAIMKYPEDISFTVAEGAGPKGTNCITQNTELVIDGSGDFSGCAFWTNLKTESEPFLMGNIFRDELYMDRYEKYQAEYSNLFLHDQCHTCNHSNLCFQCPAGNLATRGTLFTPTSICQKMVRFYDETRQLIVRKKLALDAMHIVHAPESELEKWWDDTVFVFCSHHHQKPEQFMNELFGVTSVRELYHAILEKYNIRDKIPVQSIHSDDKYSYLVAIRALIISNVLRYDRSLFTT